MVDSIKRGYDEFLLKEIKEYIMQELKSNKTLEQIENELLNAGHEKNAIQKAIQEIDKHNFKNFKKSNIKDETEKKLIEAIQHFIKEQKKLNRPLKQIKKVLLDYGHSEKLIQKALDSFEHDPESQKTYILPTTQKLIKEHVMLTSIVSLILLITITGSIINENIFLIFLGFIPSFVTILIVYYYVEKLKEKSYIIPFATNLIFILVSTISPILKTMEYQSLTVINFLISIIITTIFHEIVKNPKEIKHKPIYINKKLPQPKVKKKTYW